MKTLQGQLLMLMLLALASVQAADLPEKRRTLTAAEQKEIAQLEEQLSRHWTGGQFEEATKVAKQIADYRAERQGADYWEAIDDGLVVERLRRLTVVPEKDWREVVRAVATVAEGLDLQRQLRYREAEAKHRQALAISQKLLGEQHPDTATSYDHVAACLNSQGQHAQALPMVQKALAIRLKVLGEQHPDTANSYNSFASCLNSQGQHAEALPLHQQALAIRLKVLGEQHPHTAQSYNNVAFCLNSQSQHVKALPLAQKALAINLKVLGEQHPDTAASYSTVAFCLYSQGQHAQALPLFQKALAIKLKVLGEQNPDTALAYTNVAFSLDRQSQHAEALPLHQQALTIYLKVLGEHHPDTAGSYTNLGICLDHQGKHAEALPLHQQALASRLNLLGEDHPDSVLSYNNVASCLSDQGKFAEALRLHQKSLAICQKVLGAQHPHTVLSYNNMAICLHRQGQHVEALPLFQKALAINLKMLGERHPDTAVSYNNVASCLTSQGKHAEALLLDQQTLASRLKVLGEQHPHTAASYNNVAFGLYSQGQHAQALPLYQKALAINLKMLGEQNADTALSYNNVAFCLYSQGQHAEAARHWEKALLGEEFGRLQASTTGFARSLFRVEVVSQRAALAATLVRLKEPLQAWQHAESALGRGLLDDLLPPTDTAADAQMLAQVDQLNQTLLPLLTRQEPSAAETKQRDTLAKERDDLLANLARKAVERSDKRVLPLERIQKQLPPNTALVFWLDVLDQHLGCVLCREDPPAWVALPGSGKASAWSDDDTSLPDRTLAALADASTDVGARQRLREQLHRQRIAPLEANLKGVKHLLVVPAGQMAVVPVEALTERYTISYVPSASVYARRIEQHRPLQPSSLLVLADPVFSRNAPALPPAPPHGLLVKAVTPNSVAARAGLRPGDVLLEYAEQKLTKPDDLKPAAGEDRVPLKLWRDGQALAGRVPGGNLGVIVDQRPIAEALADWRKQQSELVALSRGNKDWPALPGTRLEARTLAGLIPKTTTLLGSEASEQKLAELATAKQLKQFRLLHLATHGEANAVRPAETALILAQDKLPTADEEAKLVLAGQKPLTGRLTVGKILADWELDADLVVLSACQTGLGKAISGEGMLGFTQALMQKGARSVVLSRWKVDDAATALLMARFYENLLGKRAGLKEPMKRAEALTEAKAWLRTLPRAEAEKRLAALVDGVPRGERGSIKAALPTRKPDEPKGEDQPFAHPYYWAGFILLGDPQ